MFWSGAIVDVPAAWFLCDGNNGTPDLRNRFIVGAGNTYIIDDSGGTNTHTHAFTGDGHLHILASALPSRIEDANDQNKITTTVPIVGTTDSDTNVPPYYSLAYIMKA